MAKGTGYPFLDYCLEPKDNYKHAKDCGFVDNDDLFLIGDSGGFLMNIKPGWKFVDTYKFSESAEYFKSHKGTYTSFKEDSILHRQFRKKEEYRRKNGFIAPCLMDDNGDIHNVRITGSHYNFLNYTRIKQLDESTIKYGNVNTAKKIYSFPKFFDSQFWIFHVLEFAELNGFHLLIDKTRRGGFSYLMAADSANTINNSPRSVVIHVAIDSKYLTATDGLTRFAINDLKFYDECTPFVRGICSTVSSDFKLGYKLANGVEADNSWGSALISVSAMNNPDCAIGKDAKKVKVEEVSTMDNFDAFMAVTEPAMRTGAYTTGMLCAWGTATSGDMQTFERNFFNVKRFNFMPFENVWDKDARNETCGFFKPYCWGLQGEVNGARGVDKDGNSNLYVGLEISKRERKVKKETSTYSDYINYIGQYANSPSESFSNISENIFSSDSLSAWAERLKIDSTLHFYIDGMLEENPSTKIVEFKSNQRLATEGKKAYDYITGVPRKQHENPHGCIRRWFAPEYEITVEGNVQKRTIPAGLYSMTYDPVGINKEHSSLTLEHSHNSIAVWQNPSYLNNYKQKLVCTYYGRPDTLEEADYICYLLARYYNCVGTVGVETNRGETVTNFKKWNALKYLECEDLSVWDDSMKGKINLNYGYVMAGDKKLDALRLLKEMLYEVIGKDGNGNDIYMFTHIFDLQTILEIIKWSIKGNYDRVSQMLLRAIQWKSKQNEAERWVDRRKMVASDVDNDNILNRDWY